MHQISIEIWWPAVILLMNTILESLLNTSLKWVQFFVYFRNILACPLNNISFFYLRWYMCSRDSCVFSNNNKWDWGKTSCITVKSGGTYWYRSLVIRLLFIKVFNFRERKKEELVFFWIALIEIIFLYVILLAPSFILH